MLKKIRLNFKKNQKELALKKRAKNKAMWEMLYGLEGVSANAKTN